MSSVNLDITSATTKSRSGRSRKRKDENYSRARPSIFSADNPANSKEAKIVVFIVVSLCIGLVFLFFSALEEPDYSNIPLMARADEFLSPKMSAEIINEAETHGNFSSVIDFDGNPTYQIILWENKVAKEVFHRKIRERGIISEDVKVEQEGMLVNYMKMMMETLNIPDRADFELVDVILRKYSAEPGRFRKGLPPHIDTYGFSASIELSDPTSYDGGDLLISKSLNNFDEKNVMRYSKTPRGTAICYAKPAVHMIKNVTRGTRYSLIIRAGLTGHDNRLNRNRNYAIDYSKQFLESPSVNADKDHRLYGMNKKWFLEDMLWKQKNQKEYDVKSYGPIETIKRLRMIYYGMSQIRSYLDWPISGHSRVFKTKP